VLKVDTWLEHVATVTPLDDNLNGVTIFLVSLCSHLAKSGFSSVKSSH
jgi:hypothetical protein